MRPDLRLPFATATHPQTTRLQELTEQWCRKFGLLRTPEVVAKFHALGYGRIMATLCPYARLDGVGLITDWNSFFFITDDQQDIAVTTNRLAQYEELVASMRHTIAGDPEPTPYHHHPLLIALRNLLGRTLPGRPAYWAPRFRENLDRWLTGHLREDFYRFTATVPEIADYIAVRRDASTVLPTLDLVEMVEGATVPDALYETPQYQTLVLGTADIMCWINDIHSLHKEQGDPINFVTVLDHHQQLGEQRAVAAVADRIVARVEDHVTALNELPGVMRQLDVHDPERVMRCALDMQSWAAGMEAWDRTDTIRFVDDESYVDDLLEMTS
ncbi:hypothetical protein [Kutzneria sp. NPDC051319]|uniref:terpene synthase family protein n=1 Tax=Kutzneria sp. NPDC051319 TaxID=3155047 RepID=UPI0034369096